MFNKLRKWRDAIQEAMRRDKTAARKLVEQGYRVADGGWKTPDGCPMFDGPGSHVSLLGHLNDIAKERGLEKDIEALKILFRRARTPR